MSDTAQPEAGGIQLPARRRGYRLTAAVLVIMMLGGTPEITPSYSTPVPGH